jgi:hypothetical protein
MRKFIADPVFVDDDADLLTIEHECLTKAKWREVFSRKDIMARTDLSGKCGSCKFFRPQDGTCYGACAKGLNYRQRSSKVCKRYEVKT